MKAQSLYQPLLKIVKHICFRLKTSTWKSNIDTARSMPVSTPACGTWTTSLTDLLSKLWLFHAPFLPETAVDIFDPEHDDTKDEDSPVYDQLYTLWRRGLLVREEGTVREGTIQFYRVLPTIRPYIEQYLARADEREPLLARFGAAYAGLVRYLYRELNRGGVAAFIALQAREDLERGVSYVTGVAQGYYLLHWGWVLQRLGNTRRGLALTEQALEIGQGQDRQLELQALNNMAAVYQATGQPKRALELYEQALPLSARGGRPCRGSDHPQQHGRSVPGDGPAPASLGVV